MKIKDVENISTSKFLMKINKMQVF